jgi:hypothetical protein
MVHSALVVYIQFPFANICSHCNGRDGGGAGKASDADSMVASEKFLGSRVRRSRHPDPELPKKNLPYWQTSATGIPHTV